MYYNNPFSGWAQAGQGQASTSVWGSGAPAPSVYGALPYPSDPSSNLQTFYFTSLNPDLLNCTVVGPHARVYYHIVTDNQMPGYTVLKNSQGTNVALIEWQPCPLIEVRGVVVKQYAKNWLRLSSERTSRSMEIRGMRYVWSPHDRTITLYTGSSGNPIFLARITRAHGTVTLDMSKEAMQLDILDSIVAATLLLQCGRNID